MTHPDLHHSPADLDALMSALVDGTITADEQARLEAILRSDRDARDAFRSFMEMESILAWELVNATPAEKYGWRSDDARGGAALRRVAIWLVPLVAATAAVTWIGPWRHGPGTNLAGVTLAEAAVLADAKDAVWTDGQPRAVGKAIKVGPLRLAAGSAQLRFRSGAIVTLNGPSDIELLGENRLFLRNGNLIPYVPPEAKGFTVVSPSGEVIDLGTEFSVDVDARGRTSVYVIDGEVDVAGGHGKPESPLRMTQGYGSRLTAGEATPVLTERPYLIDDFSADARVVRWRDLDGSRAARVVEGTLRLPVEFRPQADHERTNTQIVIDHDLSGLLGRRSVISFKTSLPSAGLSEINRWLACVIDAGVGPPPMAYEPTANLAVLVSPNFQAGVRFGGEQIWQANVFARSEDAVGPYQVVIEIDDTPAAHGRHAAAVARVTVNGQVLVSDRPLELGERPRIGLQTFVSERNVGRGEAIVDDFSVSVSADTSDDGGLTGPPGPAWATLVVDGSRPSPAAH